jgi:hypothetical protein
MPASPNVENYQYGAGACYLKIDDVDVAFRHVGNVPELTASSEITTLDHKQSMSGLKSTDLEIITEVAKTLNMTMEEVTPENMALFVMGTISTATDGEVRIGGLTKTSMLGDFRFISDNPNGRQMEFNARVSVRPNGDFNFITDGLNSIPVTMKVLKNAGEFGVWSFPPEA